MREAMGYATKAVSDHKHKELHPDEIFNLFKQTFENITEPYSINEVHFQQKDGGIVTKVTSTFRGKTITTEASGNGRLDAVSNALKKAYELKYSLETYQEHALERSSSSKAISYVGIKKPDGTLAWGAGVDADIIRASIDALVTAINNRQIVPTRPIFSCCILASAGHANIRLAGNNIVYIKYQESDTGQIVQRTS